jgi:hypothetical protein
VFVYFMCVFTCIGKIYRNCIFAQKKVHFGSFCAFEEFWMSTVTFRYQNDTGHFSEVDFKTVRRFRKPFRIPINYRRTTTHGGATTTCGGQNKFQLPFYFPILIVVYFYFKLFG